MRKLKILNWIGFFGILSMTAEGLQAAPPNECIRTFSSAQVQVEECTRVNTDSHTLTTLRLQIEDREDSSQSLVLQALLDTSPESHPQLWSKLWVSSKRKTLRKPEQLMLRKQLETLDQNQISFQTRTLLNFLAHFVAADESVPELESSPRLGHRKLHQSYTPICESIGSTREGSYKLNGQNVVISVLVGDPATRCRGRCGSGCPSSDKWSANQYTQECLDHDVCHTQTGSQLGPCKEAFWKAAYGFLFAPNCP